jgi:hypothetical protein
MQELFQRDPIGAEYWIRLIESRVAAKRQSRRFRGQTEAGRLQRSRSNRATLDSLKWQRVDR